MRTLNLLCTKRSNKIIFRCNLRQLLLNSKLVKVHKIVKLLAKAKLKSLPYNHTDNHPPTQGQKFTCKYIGTKNQGLLIQEQVTQNYEAIKPYRNIFQVRKSIPLIILFHYLNYRCGAIKH